MKPKSNTNVGSLQMPFGRRRVIQSAGALCALSMLRGRSAFGLSALEESPFERFTQRWEELTADYLNEDYPMQETYMHLVAGEAAGLDPSDVPPMLNEFFKNERLVTGPAYSRAPLFALVVRMEPHSVQEPHDHPGHVVMTMGIAGMASYQHYDLLGEVPPKDDRKQAFRVRETRRGVLRPGSMTHLSIQRDNLHAFQAGPEGALMVDFTTKVGDEDFGMLAIDKEPEDAFAGIHKAHWKEIAF